VEAAGIEPAQRSCRGGPYGVGGNGTRATFLPTDFSKPPPIGETSIVPPLDISADQFEAFAHRVVAITAEYLATLDDRLTVQPTSAASTSAAFDLPVSEAGLGESVLDDLTAITAHVRANTGRRLPYVVGSGESIAALGDFYASVLNQNVTAWRSAPAAASVERSVVRWLADAVGCGDFSGSLTSGGSLANLMGLAMAREARAPANETGAQSCVLYASDEVHMSIPKSVATLGIGRDNLRLVRTDDDFRIDLDALEEAITADRRAGREPIALVASAGTITTGAVDPLTQLAEIARANELWLHVDGAYGAFAALAAPAKFEGLWMADSISLDAHKWLFQPLDCSLLLFRDPEVARSTFSYTGDYAKTLSDDPIEGFAFFEESLELSRRFRALKLWLSLRYHGLGAFRSAIGENLRQARLLATLVEEEPSLELLAPVELSAVCFRWSEGPANSLNQRNAQILSRVTERGHVWISNANIRGVFGLRACIVNHRTTDDDVRTIVHEVVTAAAGTA
jgi:aromatic-L-amino-acid/L-tryptophan decarboxylase